MMTFSDGRMEVIEGDLPLKERLSSTDLIFQLGDIETLRQESVQLRDLFIGEIQAMENIVASKQEGKLSHILLGFLSSSETKSARATASDLVQKYSKKKYG
jgi:hypothetical protein